MNFKPEPKQPHLCKEAEEIDTHDGFKSYRCYWRGNFAEINAPCYRCEHFRPREGEEMTLREMLQRYLSEIDADGLCNPGCECGCPLDQLAPLGDCLDLDECLPARFVPPDDPEADLDLLQRWPEGYYVPIEETRP